MSKKRRRKPQAKHGPKKSADHPDQAVSRPKSARGAGRKRMWFILAAVLGVPLSLLVGTELVLRLLGVGYRPGFFRPCPTGAKGVLVENPDFSLRFFPPQLRRKLQPLRFALPKPPDTLRIFVMGGSAAEGDPEPSYGFARQLEVLLQARLPDRRVEVLNTAATAINSHVVRAIASDCTRCQGDIWIVYLGNNEVIGPYGAGTVLTPQVPSLGLIHARLALTRTRLGQLLDRWLTRLGSAPEAPSAWGGMEMFLRYALRRDDPRLQTVYHHFEQNLRDIVRLGTGHGAKVLVSSVAVNLRDCPPFGSVHRPGLEAAALQKWQTHFDAGLQAEQAGQFEEAWQHYEQAAAIDADYAELQFHRARCAQRLGRLEEAGRLYRLARDLDTLRFRADSQINAILRRVAQGSRSAQVAWVDADAMLSRGQPADVPGEESFHEHVHLTVHGNYLLARAFAEKIVRTWFATGARPVGQRNSWLNEDECAARLALTDFDRLRILEGIWPRLVRPPFSNQRGAKAREDQWEKRMQALYARITPESLSTARQVYDRALKLRPHDWRLHANYGALLYHYHQMEQARQAFEQTVRLLPHSEIWNDLLGRVEIDLGHFDKAAEIYERLRAMYPRKPAAYIGLGLVAARQRQWDQALDYFDRALACPEPDPEARVQRGICLVELDRKTDALREFEAALRLDPANTKARLHLAQTHLNLKHTGAALTNALAVLLQEPRNVEARLIASEALARTGNAARGLELLAPMAQLHPSHWQLRMQMAALSVRLARYEQARQHLEAALQANPNHAGMCSDYGNLLAMAGKLEEACAQFREAIRLDPGLILPRINLAKTLLRMGKLAEAATELNEALRRDPTNREARSLKQQIEMSQANSPEKAQ